MQNNVHRNVIALTGILGSGKSTATGFFADLGAAVVSADELSRFAVRPESPALQKIRDLFGPRVILKDGALNRPVLARVIFSDSSKRQLLEQIVHPIVAELSEDAFTQALNAGYKVVIYDCPLLFEAGLDRCGFREIILVTAGEATCIKRIVARDNITPAEAKKRMVSQLPLEEKIGRATIVIDNSGSLSDLKTHVKEVYEYLSGRLMRKR